MADTKIDISEWPYEARTMVGYVQNLMTKVKDLEAEKLQLQKGLGAIQPYNPYMNFTWDNFEPHRRDETRKCFAQLLNQAATNDAIYAQNKTLVNALIDMIKAMGFKSRISDPKSRAHMPPQINAPWVEGLFQNLRPPQYTVQWVQLKMTWYSDRCNDWDKGLVEMQRKKEAAAKIEQTKIERMKAIVKANMLLGTDWASISGVIDDLRSRDKYLDLAIAGEDTRGDWSDGFYRVENALGRFTVTSDIDRNIMEEYQSIMNADHEDGRIFRDCTYDYGTLYGMVDAKIYEVYKLFEGFSR